MGAPTLAKVLVSILSGSVIALTSCGERQPSTDPLLKQAAEDMHEVELIDGYYSSDLQKAESSLLGRVELYSGARFEKVDGVKVTRALTHTRLYLLYSQTQRTNEAAAQRAYALQLYLGSPEYTEQERWTELLRAVDALDLNREVEWKSQK